MQKNYIFSFLRDFTPRKVQDFVKFLQRRSQKSPTSGEVGRI